MAVVSQQKDNGDMKEQALEQYDDEISLFDLWDTLRDGWRLALASTVLGFLGAGIAVAVLPAKYETISAFAVGKVDSATIEPAAIAVERIKTPAFQLKVAEIINDQEWHKALKKSASETNRYLAATIVKNSASAGKEPLIELKVKATSAEKTKQIADATINELSKRHQELAQPLIDQIRENLAVSKQKVQKTTTELEILNKAMHAPGISDIRLTQLATLAIQKESAKIGEMEQLSKLESSLSPLRTSPTQVLENGSFVSEDPVFPKTRLMLGLGTIGGLILGVLAVFTLDAWRRAVRERAARTQAAE